MKLTKIETGNLKLDGGAMFGVVPKVLWSKFYNADENNLVNLCMRCLLVETNDRKILIDTGLGTKQDPKFLQYYYLNGNDSLEKSLKGLDIDKEQITDVLFSHLHFDHCGGALQFNEKREVVPVFPNASYWCSKPQWNNATNPNKREKPSYLAENIMPLKESGQLNLFDDNFNLVPGFQVKLYFGHTIGLAVPFINTGEKTIVYVSDLMPAAGNVTPTWVPAYDINPLVSINEKEQFLLEAYEQNYYLFFEHDIYIECCNIKKTEKGYLVNQTMSLKSLI